MGDEKPEPIVSAFIDGDMFISLGERQDDHFLLSALRDSCQMEADMNPDFSMPSEATLLYGVALVKWRKSGSGWTARCPLMSSGDA